jgi:hypothetical protein
MRAILTRRPMMPGNLLRRCLVLGVVFHMPACGSTPPTVAPGAQVPGPETVALATTLGQQGALAFVEVMPPSAHPYFRVPAARYLLNGESLYAFEYASANEATADAGRIAPDGSSVGMTQISWTSEPHFYRSGAVIVLYVGKQADTLALLQRVLGQQIAGA